MDGMGKDWGMDSMNWGMDGMGKDWGMDSMGNGVSHGMDGMDRSSVDSMVNHGVGDSMNRGSSNISTSGGRGIDSLSRVGHLSNVTINVIGMIGNSLDPAVRKVDGVRSLHDTSPVVRLGLLEGSLGVVVVDSIGVGVRGGLG